MKYLNKKKNIINNQIDLYNDGTAKRIYKIN